MAFRDLIPWSRQENHLSARVGPEQKREPESHPLLSLHREVNRLFDDVFRNFAATAVSGFDMVDWPRVELAETEKELRITAELPGLDEKDVEITVEDGVLTLHGEKRSEIEDKDRGYTERSYGRFERRIGLPNGVDREKAGATFKNGVLTVTLPKTAEAINDVRRIPINGKSS